VTKHSKKISATEARQKIYRYCAYQERCHQEVRNKLYEYGLRTGDVDDIIAHLITEGFLNEERFAIAFAGGKFRMKQWGRLKIIRELEARGLTANCIRAGLKTIDPQQYEETLEKLLEKKNAQLGEKAPAIRDNALAEYALQKGYESELVWKKIKEFRNVNK